MFIRENSGVLKRETDQEQVDGNKYRQLQVVDPLLGIFNQIPQRRFDSFTEGSHTSSLLNSVGNSPFSYHTGSTIEGSNSRSNSMRNISSDQRPGTSSIMNSDNGRQHQFQTRTPFAPGSASTDNSGRQYVNCAGTHPAPLNGLHTRFSTYDEQEQGIGNSQYFNFPPGESFVSFDQEFSLSNSTNSVSRNARVGRNNLLLMEATRHHQQEIQRHEQELQRMILLRKFQLQNSLPWNAVQSSRRLFSGSNEPVMTNPSYRDDLIGSTVLNNATRDASEFIARKEFIARNNAVSSVQSRKSMRPDLYDLESSLALKPHTDIDSVQMREAQTAYERRGGSAPFASTSGGIFENACMQTRDFIHEPRLANIENDLPSQEKHSYMGTEKVLHKRTSFPQQRDDVASRKNKDSSRRNINHSIKRSHQGTTFDHTVSTVVPSNDAHLSNYRQKISAEEKKEDNSEIYCPKVSNTAFDTLSQQLKSSSAYSLITDLGQGHAFQGDGRDGDSRMTSDVEILYPTTEEYDAACMLQFLQNHASNNNAGDSFGIENESRTAPRQIITNTAAVEKELGIFPPTSVFGEKKKRRGRPPKVEIESWKKTQVLAVSSPNLPYLRNHIPPWKDLVRATESFCKLEDRDELYIPEDDEEERIGREKNRGIPSASWLENARQSIDPSFDCLFVAMAQLVPCRLTVEDQNCGITSYKNLPLGFVGLACRHCGGRPGSGRYFPSTIRSLSQTTTAQNMIKHFICASTILPEVQPTLNTVTAVDQTNAALGSNANGSKSSNKSHCTSCPYAVWVWLTEFQRRLLESKETDDCENNYRGNQAKQRVKYGARKIFYSRVWNRLNEFKFRNGCEIGLLQDCSTENVDEARSKYNYDNEAFVPSKKRKV